MSQLIDRFGRVVTKLRLSVTDQCNMRCIYCMPSQGVEWIASEERLTFDEMKRIVNIMTMLGVRKIRITGGEPLLRPGVEQLISSISKLDGVDSVSMTTNGYFLYQYAKKLYDAGLRGINVSLDSLNPGKFHKMTRRKYFERVVEGIEEAEKTNISPIKINVVVIKGYNDDEIEDLAKLSRSKPYKIRFIEFMPLDGGNRWKRNLVVTKSEILEKVSKVAEIEHTSDDPSDPARIYRFKDGGGEIGIIASVSEPFCADCNRIRLTADGKIMTCLFALDEHDLKSYLRGDSTDEDIMAFLIRTIKTKWAGHSINSPHFVKPKRYMSAIGG